MNNLTAQQGERAKRILREEADDIQKQINRLNQRRNELIRQLNDIIGHERESEGSK